MEYAFLKFNDELKINIAGLGLVPAISLYPKLWELYLKKLSLHSDYLSEIIKGLKDEDNKASEIDKELRILKSEIEKKTISLGISPVIAVVKIGESNGDVVVRNLITNEIFYVNASTFKNNITNEFDAKKYLKMGVK